MVEGLGASSKSVPHVFVRSHVGSRVDFSDEQRRNGWVLHDLAQLLVAVEDCSFVTCARDSQQMK